MATMTTLHDLFLMKLRYVYDAEQRLTKALPELAEAAASTELRQAFLTHLRETETHVQRAEQLFEMCGSSPNADTNSSMKGIISAGEDIASLKADDPVRDAALISAAQETEHYEIAAYGTLRTWASVLGMHDAATLLETTLTEEKKTDQLLTQIAESLNFQAMAPRA